MQCVILAGGLGTRLWPLTTRVPKPMVSVAGIPFLEHLIRMLGEQNIRRFLLLTGYLGEQIEDYFGDGSAFGASITYSREPRPAGTGGALRHALELLDTSFLLLYGDSYLPIEYRPAAASLNDPRVAATVVVYGDTSEATSVPNNIAFGSDGFVIRYLKGGGTAAGLTHLDAGAVVMRRSVVADLVPGDAVISLESDVFPRLISQRRLYAFETKQRFYDIGTPERLRIIEEVLANGHHAHTVSR
jgi:NDP-sugar pyrophosphorylase family protein